MVGGLGQDTLIGGAGDDILANGTTTYDVFSDAFKSIMAEWTRTDKAFALRVASLKSGTGLNGSNLLNLSTLVDDAFIDSLTGGLDNDWFFAAGDTTACRPNS